MKFYYFPIDQIKQGSSVALYGYGVWGRRLLEWSNLYNWCNIRFVIDKSASAILCGGVKVYPIENVPDWDVDYVLLSSKKWEKEYIGELRKIGFPQDKIVYLSEGIEIDDSDAENKKASLTMSELGERNYFGENGNNWYERAESGAANVFELVLEPVLNKYSLMKHYPHGIWLDFGCGEGRLTNILKNTVNKIFCCDISEAAVNRCRQRFINDYNVECFVNGKDHIPLADNSVDVFFSVGTMVGFNLREMRCFLAEINRILRSGGFCILHHSNWRRTKAYFEEETVLSKDYLRGDVSADDVRVLAEEYKFVILEQKLCPWGRITENIDCITILSKQ